MTTVYDNFASFPIIGIVGNLYIDKETSVAYWWNSTIQEYEPIGDLKLTVTSSDTQIIYNDGGFLTGSDNLTFTNGNVGIGVKNPLYKLDVNGPTKVNHLFSVFQSGLSRLKIECGSSTSKIVPENGNFLHIVSNRIYLGTSTPTTTYSLNWEGSFDRSIGVGRSSNTGLTYNLSLFAGGARPGDVNQNGGNIILNAGTSTGSGSSYVSIFTATPGASGTTDVTPTEKVRIDGNGNTLTKKGTYQYHSQTIGVNTSGDWRYYVSGDNFIFERYDGSNWIEKSKIMN